MTKVYLGVGSNTEPEENLRLAVRELEARFGPLELSIVYRSAAAGFDGADFLNLVVGSSRTRVLPVYMPLLRKFTNSRGADAQNPGTRRERSISTCCSMENWCWTSRQYESHDPTYSNTASCSDRLRKSRRNFDTRRPVD